MSKYTDIRDTHTLFETLTIYIGCALDAAKRRDHHNIRFFIEQVMLEMEDLPDDGEAA